MRKTLSASPLVLCGLCLLSLIGLPAYGQRWAREENGRDVKQTVEHPNGVVQDWTGHHVLYPRFGEIHSLIAVQNDPRAILSWQAAARQDWHLIRVPRRFLNTQSVVNRDWSISLGGGTVAPSMYPAKFTFDVNATANCLTDFAVFPVNVAGSGTQPNIAAFNNLYSGTAGGTGICNRAIPPAGDDGVSATTFWSYNITAAGGLVTTSPSLSLDGTKVAFVETGAATTAHFHVLAWKSGDGVDITTPSAQNVLKPVSITSGFAALAPVAGAGTVTDLALGSTSDTLSSPFVDYVNDVAYIGNDSGVLFRVKNVFCTLACTPGVTAAPSLDTNWASTGALTIGGTCTGKLTGAVIDNGTGHVFVGCADGNVYGFTSAGLALAHSPLAVGNGTSTGGVVDPPVIDAVNKFLYAVSGSSGGASVIVQASTVDLGSTVTATMGAGGFFNVHAPSFSTGYFNSVTTTDWLLYDWALNAGATADTLYGVTFSAGHVMNGPAAADSFTIVSSTPAEFSPTTTFLNGATDQLFSSALAALTPNFIEYNVSAFGGLFPTSFPPTGATGATSTQGSGTSAIIVDNTSASAQASSIYFGVAVANTAVKLTQSGLN